MCLPLSGRRQRFQVSDERGRGRERKREGVSVGEREREREMSWAMDRGELDVWPVSLADKNGRETERDGEREGKRAEREMGGKWLVRWQKEGL